MGGLLAQAVAEYRRGALEAAVRTCRLHLEDNPGDWRATELAAACATTLKQIPDAIAYWEALVALKPDHPLAHGQLARLLAINGRTEDALPHFTTALTLDSDPELRMAYAAALESTGRMPEAKAQYEQVTADNPAHAGAHACLAYLAEMAGRFEAAARHVSAALAIDSSNVSALLTQSRLDERAGETARAVATLQDLRQRTGITESNRALIEYRLAALADRGQKYAAAYAHAERAGQLQREGSVVQASMYDDVVIHDLDEFFAQDEAWSAVPNSASGDAEAPVFIVGFPRSGTTLLERMLRTTPSVTIVDERDTLGPILQHFLSSRESLDRLLTIEPGELAHWREQYFASRLMHAPTSTGLIVDKMPLYSLFVGIISRLFPEARFVVPLRDPRDVCISCLLQAFAPNPAMLNFTSLDQTTRYYARVMGLFCRLQDRLSSPTCTYRYEDLVKEPEAVGRKVFSFLDLAWSVEALRYHERARGEIINTPSYAQVSKPLYQTSIGRWRNYESHLAPFIDRLNPFIERFGYSRS